MNNKITMPALVALLALKSGLSKEESESFLKEFFKLISETLCSGETVKIKALGTFKILDIEMRKSVNVTNGEEIIIPEHKRIVFLPSKEIAEVINAPFSMFDSVELHPDAVAEIEGVETTTFSEPVKEEPKQEIDSNVSKESGEDAEARVINVSADLADGKESDSVIITNKDKESEKIVQEGGDEETVESKDIILDDNSLQESQFSESSTSSVINDTPHEKAMKKGGKGKFIIGFFTGLLLAILTAGLIYFFFLRPASKGVVAETVADTLMIEPDEDYEDDDNDYELLEDSISFLAESENGKSEELTPSETNSIEKKNIKDEKGKVEDKESKMAATEPSDKPKEKEEKVVKDVIGDRRFLITMAQIHYGNHNLWPYIYEENKKILGHPDRIKPGTVVVIPSLSKYGIDPKNPDDIKKAKRLGVEIYKRFK